MMQHLSKLECLALLAGCLCHDVDHRGTNNAFQAKYVTIMHNYKFYHGLL